MLLMLPLSYAFYFAGGRRKIKKLDSARTTTVGRRRHKVATTAKSLSSATSPPRVRRRKGDQSARMSARRKTVDASASTPRRKHAKRASSNDSPRLAVSASTSQVALAQVPQPVPRPKPRISASDSVLNDGTKRTRESIRPAATVSPATSTDKAATTQPTATSTQQGARLDHLAALHGTATASGIEAAVDRDSSIPNETKAGEEERKPLDNKDATTACQTHNRFIDAATQSSTARLQSPRETSVNASSPSRSAPCQSIAESAEVHKTPRLCATSLSSLPTPSARNQMLPSSNILPPSTIKDQSKPSIDEQLLEGDSLLASAAHSIHTTLQARRGVSHQRHHVVQQHNTEPVLPSVVDASQPFATPTRYTSVPLCPDSARKEETLEGSGPDWNFIQQRSTTKSTQRSTSGLDPSAGRAAYEDNTDGVVTNGRQHTYRRNPDNQQQQQQQPQQQQQQEQQQQQQQLLELQLREQQLRAAILHQRQLHHDFEKQLIQQQQQQHLQQRLQQQQQQHPANGQRIARPEDSRTSLSSNKSTRSGIGTPKPAWRI